MNLRNGKIGIIDLSTGESSEEDFAGDVLTEGVPRELLEKHGPDSIVLGTGLLTGSLIPASCVGTLTTGRHTMPILGHAGIELKLTGFDFLVLKGKASNWGYIWIRDGIMEFVEMPESPQLNSWQRTEKIRSDQGDSKIQVLSGGPWCDAGSPAAQLVVDHWGGEDKVGMGAEFGKRNLAAVAFRGMGELEVADPEAHFEKSVALMRGHLSRLALNKGLQSYYEGAAVDDFVSLAHRYIGCYGCPYPCRSYLKTEEDPKEMRLMHKEPGYLHYDIPALEMATKVGLSPRDATRVLVRCARAGAEPVAVMAAALASSAHPDVVSIDALLARHDDIRPASKGNFELSFPALKDYETCLGLGLCPRYWAKVGFDIGAISSCAESALGHKLM